MEQQEEKKENQESFLFPSEDNADNEEKLAKKAKREIIFEMVLFLVLGILLGITIKTEATKRITIGFNDYKIANGKNDYNIEDIKNNLQKQAQTEQQTAGQQGTNNNQ
jgi:hypothetical protein